MRSAYVVGSGPNGLTAAIVLAKAGVRVTVLEAQSTVGGGTRSEELTLKGFTHDVCSAVHPLAVSSPAFRSFPLDKYGLEWIVPPLPFAHPLDQGAAVFDAHTWSKTLAPFADHWQDLVAEILRPWRVPHHPFLMARFGALALGSAKRSAEMVFDSASDRALFAGVAAHSMLPLEKFTSAAVAWVLASAARAVGWPIPKGGSQKIASALAAYLESLGGKIICNQKVTALAELRDADAALCDITPRQVLRIAGDQLPASFARKLETYRYGPGVFKMDWALRAPIPWTASECARAGTVHVGGTFEEVAASERAAWERTPSDKPFVLVTQPSLFDSTRAPAGQHTAWAYCHVPHGSTVDMSDRIENQIERFAPGFKTRIVARHAMGPAELERRNANLIGGDINGGVQDLGQLFLRPTRLLYRTPLKSLYLCSSSTPPGGGVHGMCGYYSAQAALRDWQ